MLNNWTKGKSECSVWAACLALQIYLFRELLFSGSVTLAHDNWQWAYPIFHFFSSTLGRGEFPLWNPYSHGGEPFYPLLYQIRLLEPWNLIQIFFFKIFTSSSALSFNWNRYLLCLIHSVTLYFLFRRLASRTSFRVILIPILLFSPIFWGTFQQDGILNQFLWIPAICLVLRDILEKKEWLWRHVFLLTVFLGWSFQSYFFSGMLLFCFLCGLGALLFCPDRLAAIAWKRAIAKLSVMLILLGGMALPNVALWIGQKDWVFPMRTSSEFQGLLGGKKLQNEEKKLNPLLGNKPQTVRMPYQDTVVTGAFLQDWDFIHLGSGEGNRFLFPPQLRWGKSSEAYLYVSLLGWMVAIIGMVLGQHPFRRPALFALAGLTLTMLGRKALLHNVLYYLFPPVWWMRNTHTLVLYLGLFLLYFFVLGLHVLWKQREKSPARFQELPWKTIITCAVIIGLSLSSLPLFKFPIDRLFLLPVLFSIWIGRVAYRCSGAVGLCMTLLIGYFLLVDFTVLLNRPDRFLPILVRHALFVGIPLIFWNLKKQRMAAAVFFTSITIDLLLVTMKVQPLLTMPIPTVPRTPNEIARQVLPDHMVGCNTRRQACMRYISLLEEKPTLFTPPNERPPADLKSPELIDWTRRQELHHSFFLLKSYPTLVLSDLGGTELETLFAIGRSPFRCVLHAGAVLKFSTDLQCETRTTRQLNSVSMNIQTVQPSLLFWSDGFDPNWRAYLDGKRLPILRIAEHFKGIALPTGNHSLQFEYRPYLFLFAMGVFYTISALGLIAGLLWRRIP
ncbi:MAG: YfhO family protein [Deltaproteobacteria bacterium]|nr:YfhO family protein [Deltaproteobacteria bacterium]